MAQKNAAKLKTFSALEFLDARPSGNLRPVYAFIGKDEFFRWKCILKIKSIVLDESLPGSTLKEFDALPDVREIFDELRTSPFLGMNGYRLVIVRTGDKLVSTARERLEKYLESPGTSSVLVLSCASLPSNTRVYKAIAKVGCIVQCPALRWREMPGWVNLCAKQLDVRIQPAAVQQLLDAVGMNPGAVESEMDKLAAYRAEDGLVRQEDVRAIVGFSKSQSVFDLIDQMGRKDIRRALETVRTLLLAGQSVQMVLAMLARNYRTLWQIYRLKKSGMSPDKAGAEAGVPPFVAEKLFKQAAGIRNESELAVRVQILSRADVESKTKSISDEGQRWLEALVVELCTIGA